MTTPSVFNHILPTQTYQSQNKPQYVSVYDQGTIASPLVITSPAGNVDLTISEANNGDATISTAGNIDISTSIINKYIDLTARETRVYGTGANPTGAVSLHNNNSYFTTYSATNSGGGLTAGHLETFSYPAGGGIIKCIDIAPDGEVNVPVQINANEIRLAGAPVPKISKVAWVGRTGAGNDTILLPPNTSAQNISATFSVVAGRAYRVSAQFGFDSDDNTNPLAVVFVNITTAPDLSVESVGMASVLASTTFTATGINPSCHSGFFVATTNSSNCRLIAGNTSPSDDAYIKTSAVSEGQDSPFILIEDLGVI